MTTPAPWLRPDSSWLASVRSASILPFRGAALDLPWRSGCGRSSSTAPTSSMESTKKRRPSCVGARPAEVCGAAISPSSSRSAMTLRTEAGDSEVSSMARQLPRADRHPCIEIALDELAEDFLAALVERVEKFLASELSFGVHCSPHPFVGPDLGVKSSGIQAAQALRLFSASEQAKSRGTRQALQQAAQQAPESERRDPPMRPSSRSADQMRDVTLVRGVAPQAEGSCLVSFGDTRVLCTASVETSVPSWRRGQGLGWVTAEYGMLPPRHRPAHTVARPLPASSPAAPRKSSA